MLRSTTGRSIVSSLEFSSCKVAVNVHEGTSRPQPRPTPAVQKVNAGANYSRAVESGASPIGGTDTSRQFGREA